jgi:galactokinase
VVIELPRGLAPEPRKDWSNYVRGVLSGYLRRGILVQGFHAYIHSTVPVGGGLSSSAALETATAALIEAMAGKRLDPLETIALCQTAEHIFAGVPCGIMDQYICRLARAGQALLLDCRSQAPTWIPFDDRSVTALIINTQVKHDLAAGEYARRRLACEEAARVMEQSTLREANPELLSRYEGRMSEQAMRCARHVVGEIARTRQAATSLRDRDWATFGRLLNESHESLKTDFKVSCAELDVVVEAAQALGAEGGVYGARMTGGGFGGCAIALVESSKREEIQAKIGTSYRRKTGIRATFFASRAAAGVSVLEV